MSPSEVKPDLHVHPSISDEPGRWSPRASEVIACDSRPRQVHGLATVRRMNPTEGAQSRAG